MVLISRLESWAGECPFGTIALDREEVKGPIKGNSKTVLHEIDLWDNKHEVVVIIPAFYWTNYYQWCLDNEVHFASVDLIAIPNQEKGYILLQKLSKLNEVSKKLQETDYYDNYTEKQWEHIRRREELNG